MVKTALAFPHGHLSCGDCWDGEDTDLSSDFELLIFPMPPWSFLGNEKPHFWIQIGWVIGVILNRRCGLMWIEPSKIGGFKIWIPSNENVHDEWECLPNAECLLSWCGYLLCGISSTCSLQFKKQKWVLKQLNASFTKPHGNWSSVRMLI